MPRNRIIKPDFFADEKVAKCSHTARLLFIGMWNFADDSGVCRANNMYLRSNIFPYDKISTNQIDVAVKQIKDAGLVKYGVYKEEKFVLINNFLKHQSIKKPSAFRFIDTEDYSSVFNFEPPAPPEEKHLMKFPDCEFVKLTEDEYSKIVKKFGEDVAVKGVEALENWLAKGNTPTAVKRRKNPSHYGQFKENNWVIKEAREAVRETKGTNWSVK